MHCYLVSGIWNSEVGLLMDSIQGEISNNMIHAFLSSLSWPTKTRASGMTGRKAFEKRTPGSGMLAVSASEGLSLYPILKCFIADNLQDPAGSYAFSLTWRCARCSTSCSRVAKVLAVRPHFTQRSKDIWDTDWLRTDQILFNRSSIIRYT